MRKNEKNLTTLLQRADMAISLVTNKSLVEQSKNIAEASVEDQVSFFKTFLQARKKEIPSNFDMRFFDLKKPDFIRLYREAGFDKLIADEETAFEIFRIYWINYSMESPEDYVEHYLTISRNLGRIKNEVLKAVFCQAVLLTLLNTSAFIDAPEALENFTKEIRGIENVSEILEGTISFYN